MIAAGGAPQSGTGVDFLLARFLTAAPAARPPAASQGQADSGRPRIGTAGTPRRCTRRSFLFRVRVNSPDGIRRAHVWLDGRRIRSSKRRRFTVRVRASRLRPGRHRLIVIVRDADGDRARRPVRFRRCAAAAARPPAARRAPRFTG